ncbi:hypothetical protein CLHUN_26720 [Ruminiclostridium hungatei]|uniref:C4-dicarboxylate anaerobic carrier n=1 Tax=Ruminiclostridium hungatei TaxID=48256 RepID=A0A1V4SJ93_RUMHU|nr:TRAP transporter large permease subunit [Ruminiclostridium hungatei]OPX43525.1 hypothetical protein CLHUN_26720 [Ruminiclostridium hungatei]
MRKKSIHTYVIMFGVIITATILTWIIPAGNFTRIFDNNLGRELILADSFKYVQATPVSLWGMFVDIFNGFVESADISFFLLFAYGYVNILLESKALEAFVNYLLVKMRGRDTMIISIFIILFAICGSTLGMYEEVLGFVPIFMAISIALGYDKLVGGSIVILGSGVGFAAATINPFSIGLASNIANIPLMEPKVFIFRICAFVLFIAVTILYVLKYAHGIKSNLTNGIEQNKDHTLNVNSIQNNIHKLEIKQILSLASFLLIIVFIGVGVIYYDFYLSEIAAIFFISMFITGFINKISINDICEKFINSSKEMMFTVLIIGFGRAIQVIITEGNIIDTIINYLSHLLLQLPKEIAGVAMLIIQNILCFFVPSGSGQAVVSIPILAPVADLLGLSRNIAILTYQFGNGFGYLFWPIGAATICGVMKIGIDQWYKYFLKLYCYFIIIQIILIMLAVVMNI